MTNEHLREEEAKGGNVTNTLVLLNTVVRLGVNVFRVDHVNKFVEADS